jgi:hypothetical protein
MHPRSAIPGYETTLLLKQDNGNTIGDSARQLPIGCLSPEAWAWEQLGRPAPGSSGCVP